MILEIARFKIKKEADRDFLTSDLRSFRPWASGKR
jgi:hypothetical protein